MTGILFLTAMFTSLAGGGLIESVTGSQDYLMNISENESKIVFGVSLELLNAVAVIGIAVTVFPLIKRKNESMAMGYVGFRFIESILCTISAVIPVLILSLSAGYLNNTADKIIHLKVLTDLLLSTRLSLAEIFIPLFFSLGAFLLYYLLFKSELIPRFLSIWGFAGAVLILVQALTNGGLVLSLLFVLPIITNEIVLGIWLIVKGFNVIVPDQASIKG